MNCEVVLSTFWRPEVLPRVQRPKPSSCWLSHVQNCMASVACTQTSILQGSLNVITRGFTVNLPGIFAPNRLICIPRSKSWICLSQFAHSVRVVRCVWRSISVQLLAVRPVGGGVDWWPVTDHQEQTHLHAFRNTQRVLECAAGESLCKVCLFPLCCLSSCLFVAVLWRNADALDCFYSTKIPDDFRRSLQNICVEVPQRLANPGVRGQGPWKWCVYYMLVDWTAHTRLWAADWWAKHWLTSPEALWKGLSWATEHQLIFRTSWWKHSRRAHSWAAPST